MIPRKAGDRVKTDRRVAGASVAGGRTDGDLWTPDEGQEAMRELIRAQAGHRGPEDRQTANAARTMLIEASWSYRHPAGESIHHLKRAEHLSQTIRDIGWKAQTRLCTRYRALYKTGKPQPRVLTAIARELAGFIWALPDTRPLPPETGIFCLCGTLEMVANDRGILDVRRDKYPFLERDQPASNLVRR